ncbi:MAG: hypothetical protein R6U02_01020 [Alkalibacterium sp.]|uniref:hypothetical protein n=1 Tax=Alkalibacterium sp. TaxID=1872447 RepID=UPI003970C6A4
MKKSQNGRTSVSHFFHTQKQKVAMLYWLILIPIVLAIITIMYFDRDSRRIILAVQLGMVIYTTYLFRRIALITYMTLFI